MMVFRNIILVPYMWIRLCWHAAHVDNYTLVEHFKILRYIVTHANKGGNVKIESYGKENIPKEDGFMFFPNHQGMYDVLAIIDACDNTFAVVAKKEVANVPLLKQVFACTKSYMMDREDIRQSMQVIMNVANDVKNGKNFLIFPEGTRSKNGNVIGEFKGGSKYDLPSAVFKFPENRTVQLWWRLRCSPTDPGSGCYRSWVAEH